MYFRGGGGESERERESERVYRSVSYLTFYMVLEMKRKESLRGLFSR